MKKWFWITIWLLFFSLFSGGRDDIVQVDASAVLPEESAYVAITFDDGPRRGMTDILLDGLRQRGASATFFLVGEAIEGQRDLVERMQAEGHQVGNHTWSHIRLEGENHAALLWDVKRTDLLLREILGESDYWLRPPYGLIEDPLAAQITVPLVKWSVDPRDWESRDTEKIVNAVLAAVEPGSIILLHDIYPTSVAAALQIIDALQEQGYWFVTVKELLQLSGIQPQAGIMYRKA